MGKKLYGFEQIRQSDKEIKERVETQVSELDEAEVDITGLENDVAAMKEADVAHDGRLAEIEPKVDTQSTMLEEMDAELQRLASWHPTGEAPPASPKDFTLLDNDKSDSGEDTDFYTKACFCNQWSFLTFVEAGIGKINISMDGTDTWTVRTAEDYGLAPATGDVDVKVYVNADEIYVAFHQAGNGRLDVFRHYRTDISLDKYSTVVAAYMAGGRYSISLGHGGEVIVSSEPCHLMCYPGAGDPVNHHAVLEAAGVTEGVFDVVKRGKTITLVGRTGDGSGRALFRSTDGGETFTLNSVSFANDIQTLYGSVKNLVIDAGASGVFISRDDGASWFQADATVDRLNGTVVPVRVKCRANVIVAVYSDNVGLFSYNAGKSWFEYDLAEISGGVLVDPKMLSIDDDSVAISYGQYNLAFLDLIVTEYGPDYKGERAVGPQEKLTLISLDKAHRVDLRLNDDGSLVIVRGNKQTVLMGTAGEIIAAGTVKGHIAIDE